MILLTAAVIYFLSLVGFTFGPLRSIGECGDIYDSSHLVWPFNEVGGNLHGSLLDSSSTSISPQPSFREAFNCTYGCRGWCFAEYTLKVLRLKLTSQPKHLYFTWKTLVSDIWSAPLLHLNSHGEHCKEAFCQTPLSISKKKKTVGKERELASKF